MALSARIGAIEFAGNEVRLAVVKTGGKRPTVLELHEQKAEFDQPEQRQEALAKTVRDLLAGVKKKPAVLVLCVPSEFAVVRQLTVPFKGARKVAAAVPFELERYLAFPIEDLVVDYLYIMEIENQTEVLAAGIRKTVLRDQLDVLKSAGVDPQGIHIDALGLTSLWRACHGAMKGLHAVLHARETHSILAVTYNKSLVYFRHLTFSLDDLRRNPAMAAQEVQNSLRAFHANWRGGGEVLSLTATGVGPLQEERERFEREFEIPISYDDFAAKLKWEKNAAEMAAPANHWEAAIGAAQSAAGGGFCMNFRKDEFAPENKIAGLVSHLVATTCLLLLVFAGIVVYYQHGRTRLIAEAAATREKIKQVQSEIEQLEVQGINVDGQVFAGPSLLDLLQEIAVRMPNDKVGITDLKMLPAAPGAPWLIIEGEVKDDAAFAAAFAELRKSRLFDVDEDPGLELEKGKSTFKIKIRKPETGAIESPESALGETQ